MVNSVGEWWTKYYRIVNPEVTCIQGTYAAALGEAGIVFRTCESDRHHGHRQVNTVYLPKGNVLQCDAPSQSDAEKHLTTLLRRNQELVEWGDLCVRRHSLGERQIKSLRGFGKPTRNPRRAREEELIFV